MGLAAKALYKCPGIIVFFPVHSSLKDGENSH